MSNWDVIGYYKFESYVKSVDDGQDIYFGEVEWPVLMSTKPGKLKLKLAKKPKSLRLK